MNRYALFGWPVGHSRSPKMQLAGFRACGIEATYECLAVPPEEFAARVRELVQADYRGWNVTVPHKERMYECCDVVAGDEARAAHSVNTVAVRDGKTYGYSTDGIGVERALRHDFGLQKIPARLLFLGAGGAAQAVSVYASRHGAQEILLANRTLPKAQALAERIRAVSPEVRVEALPLSAAADVVKSCDLLFQCTSLGLKPDDPMPIAADAIPRELPVFDFVYTPSAFRSALQQRGVRICDGLEMLLQQGMESFRIWTGCVPPEDAMRKGLASC